MAIISAPVYGGLFDSTSVEETVGGFPRGNKAVDSAFFAKLISCFYSDGVLGEDSFRIVPGGGMRITAQAGVAWIRGYMAWLKADLNLTLTPGAAYSIVLRLNVPAGEFTLCAATDAPLVNDSIRDLVLAEVSVPAGAASVTAAMISDTRGDGSKCGIVTSTVDALASCATAQNANMLGGVAASGYLKRSGGTMTGKLTAAAEKTGASAVRNISYGRVMPTSLKEGEIFILLSE